MSLETTAAPKNALLLGMVFSIEKDPLTGQMFRDRVRCEAMERLGFNVKTLDDKHDGDVERVRNFFSSTIHPFRRKLTKKIIHH